MSADSRRPTAPNWNDPEHCPFCGLELEDGGPAFMAHVDLNPPCEAGFERWRAQVVDDVSGEWSG